MSSAHLVRVRVGVRASCRVRVGVRVRVRVRVACEERGEEDGTEVEGHEQRAPGEGEG